MKLIWIWIFVVSICLTLVMIDYLNLANVLFASSVFEIYAMMLDEFEMMNDFLFVFVHLETDSHDDFYSTLLINQKK